MSYRLILKGIGDTDLYLTESHVVIDPVDGQTEEIFLGDIRKIHLIPVRRTSHWYFPPTCIIKTDDKEYRFSTREKVFHSLTSIVESSEEDLDLTTGIVLDLFGFFCF